MWSNNLFCLLFLFLSSAFAALVSQDEAPKAYFHWSGAWRYSEDAGNIDDQLPSLARQAYEDMVADAKSKNSAKIPSVMTALAIDSDVYFSSSLKGPVYLVNPGQVKNYVQEGVAEEVYAAIIRCQENNSDKGHRYNAQCGEPMAAQQYLVNNPDKEIKGKGRVTTYGNLDPDDDSKVGILDPCKFSTGKNQYGCTQLVSALGLTKKGNQGDKPGLPNIQPKEELPHCWWT